MKTPRLLLATVNWVSLITLIWLLILDLVPLGWIQTSALIFFFIVALISTIYRDVAYPREKNFYEQTHKG